ncbi:IS4 family transposase [Aeromonas veronii bv. sobria]|nr:IS4 family transposase [Aeromonas veronii]TEY81008.1 IS4 family transposase [Aeromonas veronii]
MLTFALHRAADWAKCVFSLAALGDPRRTARLVNVATQLAKYSGKSITHSSEGSEAMQEGAYRLIRNPHVSAAAIRKAGAMRTVELAQAFPELLAIEDTTSLSYRHQVAEELGKLGATEDKSRGWWVHSVLLLEAATFRTVGLLHQEWWMRPDDPADAVEKESGKWLAAAATCRQRMGNMMSKVIAVCDREADIYAYMQDKLAHQERFVVRSKHRRKDIGSGLCLYDHLCQQPELGGYQVTIPQKSLVDKRGKRKNRPARKATLCLRSGSITLKQGSLTLNAVLAEEVNPPKGETPLKWLLLTSEPVASLAQALRVIDIYTHRWRVEDFHKAWKTGAGAERQRMEEPDNMERMVSILSFVAVRLLQLRESFTLPQELRVQGLLREAEHVENQSCETVLTQDECQLLNYLDKGKRKRKEREGSLQWAYMAIARLGGFMDSKRTGIAGWSSLWEGWQTLQSKLDGFIAAKEMMASGIKI